jgi:hypothetical protein
MKIQKYSTLGKFAQLFRKEGDFAQTSEFSSID